MRNLTLSYEQLSNYSRKDKENLLAELKVRLIKNARSDPNAFVEYILGKKQIPMHHHWQELASEFKRLVILAPRSHGKTTQIAVLRVLWELGRNPDIRIKIACATEKRARDVVLEIAKYIERSSALREVFPHLRIPKDYPWTQAKIYVNRDTILKDASVEACGILSGPTGSRADLIIFDDICDYKNSILEPGKRELVKDAFFGNWLDILDSQESRIIYIGTRWHEEDCTSVVLKTPGFKHVEYSIDEHFNPLWEEKFPKKALMDKYRERGAFYFNRAYRNQPSPSEEKIFPLNLLHSCVGEKLSDDFLKSCDFYTGIDLAIGRSPSAHFTCIFTIAVDDKKIRYPVEIKRLKVSSPETARAIVDTYSRFQPKLILVENNQYQQALIDWMEDLNLGLPLGSYFTGAQKMSLDFGIPSLASEFQNKQWVIPLGEVHEMGCRCWYCLWFDELYKFPNGSSTDLVMASWLAREAARKFSVQVGDYILWEL